MKYKINEDIFYSTSADTFSFYIENNGVTIFKGRAYKSPDKATCDINITDICRDWVCNKLPDFRNYTDSAVSQTEAYQEFKLYTYSGNTEELVPMLLETYNILFDWDYDMPWSGQSCTLSEPVNGHMDNRMKLVYSVYRDTTGESICYIVKRYPKISVKPKSLTYPSASSEQALNVSSNIPFSAITDNDWISISPVSGSSGVTVLYVTVTTNNYPLKREGVVKIKYYNEVYEYFEYISIPVYQKAAMEYIRMSATATVVPYTQNNQTITVSSNTECEFEIIY